MKKISPRHIGAALIAIALAVTAGYAGINILYKESTVTVGVVDVPIIWGQGLDYANAETAGYVAGYTPSPDNTYITLTVNGAPELEVTIDDLLRLDNQTDITSFKVKISTAISGDLVAHITTLKLRFWIDEAPTSDDGAIVLDLAAAAGTATIAMSPYTGEVSSLNVQLVIELASGALESESATVKIRLTDIIQW